MPVDFHNPEPRYKVAGLRAAGHRVTVVDQIGVANPRGRNLGKVARYARRILRRGTADGGGAARQLLIVPPRHHLLTDAINDRLVRRGVRRALRGGGAGPILWFRFPSPELVRQIGRLGESLVVYDCVDRYARFGYPRRATEALVAAERRLLAHADLTLVTSDGLRRFAEALSRNVVLHHNGVDAGLFADPAAAPPDIAALPRPVFGYTGKVDERLDVELLARVAERHPRGSVAIVGGRAAGVDAGRLAALPNVHLLAQRPHDELPGCVQAFDVGLLPYRRSPVTDDVFPVKSLEYLAAGIPCVATDLPELRRFAGLITVAGDAPAFLDAVEEALSDDDPGHAAARRAAAHAFSWPERTATLLDILEGVPGR